MIVRRASWFGEKLTGSGLLGVNYHYQLSASMWATYIMPNIC